MTFLDTIKSEMIEAPFKKPCCRRNMLYGMLAARGRMAEDGLTELRLSHKGTVELAVHLIKEQFGRDVHPNCGNHGGRVQLLRFESAAAKRFLDEIALDASTGCMQKPCPACAAAYFRGLFLAAGHVSDPQKAYHLEFSLGDWE